MKKLIIGMVAALTAITGYSATDAELKAMLDAKEYANFAYSVNLTQLTNLATSADAPYICEIACSTNKLWIARCLCEANLMSYKSACDIALEKQHPQTFLIALRSGNDELILNTWEKVLDIPNVDIRVICNYFTYDNNKMKVNNLALTQKTAELILSKYPLYYTQFIFRNYQTNITDEYKAWAESCVKNVNEKTCEINGWNNLMAYKPELLESNDFYFENCWKATKALTAIGIFKKLVKTPYYNKAIDAIASSVTDPTTALAFAKIIDKNANNNEMTKKLYPVISNDIHCACEVAFYLNDIDKVINIMINAGEELTAEELNKMIPMINALDVDHRSAEVVKALRNINSRYTLRLYNERETWEPILSKIRAMIDVRQ